MNKFLDSTLKWFMQIAAMLGDLALIGAAVFLIIASIETGNMFLFMISGVLIWGSYKTWKSQGGFIAWTHRKQFMNNWDNLCKRSRLSKKGL